MLIYLNNLKNETATAVTNKLINSNKRDEATRRKSLYIDIKIDIFLDNRIVDLII